MFLRIIVFALIMLLGKSSYWGNIDLTFRVIYKGDGVAFSCLGNKNTQWSKAGVPVKSHYKQLDSDGDFLVVHTIFNVGYEDVGTYACSGRGRKEDGTKASWSSDLELHVVERDDGGVISNRQQSKIGQRVYMRCDYTGEIKWFFMRNPQLPNRRPQAWGKTLNMMSNEHDSGFYICMGSRGDNRTYISKVFLEVLRVPHLTERTFSEADEKERCAVCISQYEVGDLLKKLSCDHEYHKACLEQWLNHNVQRPTCPTCRNPIDPDE